MEKRGPVRDYWQFTAQDGASDQCFLFTDAFGRILQLSLAVAAILVLYIKRKLEHPARPLKVWAMDVGKQCVGSVVCHWVNIVFSILFVSHAAADDDECGIYFVTYLGDMTFGLALVISLLRLVRALAVRFNVRDLVDSGYYGDPPSCRVWCAQLCGYMAALLLSKLTMFAALWVLYRPLASGSKALFAGFESHRHLELLLVMVVLPGVCNSFQFWILDSHLKCSGDHWKYNSQPGTPSEKHQIHQQLPVPPIVGGVVSIGVVAPPPPPPLSWSSGGAITEPKLAIPL
ncbi:hypothetical protein PybrP1_003279 [[Pythium] brassicae (nom. inval.)]|nr:hypothetical protein PybrP1_003279 [[Pythium] brassicae (nom. inval.)]